MHLISGCERSLFKAFCARIQIDVLLMHEWDGCINAGLRRKWAALSIPSFSRASALCRCSNFPAGHVMKSLAAAPRLCIAPLRPNKIHLHFGAREADSSLLPCVCVCVCVRCGLVSAGRWHAHWKHRRGQDAPAGSRQAAGWNEPPIRDMSRLWNIG